MYEIRCKINNNGTMIAPSVLPIHLGTKGDKNCVKLSFEIGDQVEGNYRYVKFYHERRTVLQRVNNSEVVLSTNVTSLNGRWHISFLSSNSVITYQTAEGSYLFSTVPLSAEISDGILDINIEDDKDRRIEELDAKVAECESFENELVGMSFTKLRIPDNVSSVGNYFLYNASKEIESLFIPKGVTRIGQYAFYGMTINKIDFEEDSSIDAFDSYAFSHVRTGDLIIPESMSDYGHYAFQGGTIRNLRFEEDSKIATLGANAFNGVAINELILPLKMTKFAGKGYVFRACNIDSVWIPKSVSTTIPQGAFYKDVLINKIILENGFNVSANFSNVATLTKESIVAMFNALEDRVGQSALSLTLGNDNLAKVTDDEINIARVKNWTVS